MSIEPTSASLTCDIWIEETFAVTANIPHITSADETKYQLGTPVVSSDAMDNDSITITGPKTEIDRIASVVAVVEEESTLSATEVFDATLKALDADGKEADISHCTMNEDNAPVTVTVPILFYRRVELANHLKLENAPSAYNNKQLVTFSPTYLELWGANENIDAFVTQLDELFTFDFDNINPDHLNQERKLPTSDTLKILGGVDTVKVTFNLRNISVKRLNLQLNSSNTQIINCPKGVTVQPTETTLNNITLYGSSDSIRKIKASDLRVVVDAANDTASGQKTLISRITIPQYPNVWVYYGETASGYDLLATVNGTG